MGPPPLAVPLLLLVLLCRAGEAGECRGRRQLLNLPRPGYVTDGRGNYSVNGNCEWLITATNSSLRILLDFTTLDTECTYDYLFIYDGDSYASPLLASLSGNTIPPPIEARSGKMLLHLFSDANYNLEGFNATYTFTPCPMGCSGHGTCHAAGTCLCQAGWGGHDCGTQDCTEYCGAHGHCNTDNRCQCEAGFMGESCDLSLKDNQSAGSWYNISSSDPQFTGRTAAAGTFLNATNSLYIFGGYSLNTVLGDLVRYNFTSNTWQRSRLQPTPAARHSHCGLEWRGGLLVMGGELGNGSLTSDVWVYEPLADQWQRLQPLSARNPPGLASHAAALVDGSLYIYGGRTEQGRFSGAMFRLDLQRLEWEEVLPAGGKSPPVAAHSMVFHPPSRTLLIHGGHRLSPRFSYRTNSTDIFHVDRRYWSSLAPRPSAAGPRERAFHTATLVGNYMVVYGGNVHIHYQEEKCYDDRIFFYHLGCHQWVSGQELGLLINSADGREGRSRRGRYSHVAALMRGNVLLVAGGFSGQSLGDLVAYKLPVFVSHVMVQNVHVDYCSLYGAEVTCSKDPECVWCQNRCQSYQPHSTCPQRGCLGLSSLLTDCQSCLVFGQSRGSPPQTPGAQGWCVQTATCLPVSEDAGCVVEPADGVDGWWGPDTTFLTSLEQCQRLDFSPGLHLLTYLQPRNYSQPDLVSVERSVSYVHAGAVELSAVLVYQGFIHPLFTAPSPADNVLVSLRLQRLYVEAQVARTPNLLDMEEVGHWLGQAGMEVRPLQRNSGDRLFPLLGRGNKYAIRIEASINNSGHGQPSEMSLAWQRPPTQDPHDITFHFLEAVRSESCELYPSCLACLSDQGCGWCPLHARCHPRSARVDAQCGRGGRLVLVPSGCPLCSEHTQCPACTQDPFCEWQAGGNRKTDFQCTRRGRSESAIRTPGHCPTPCHRRATCRDCLSNSSQCAWCQSTNTCFLFTTYLAKYPSGQCTDWYDSIHSVKQCRDCADFTGCQECVQNFQCGWCGNADNPTIGRCVAGDFSSVRGYPDCASAVRVQGNLSGSGAVAWSYAVCPDIDECRLQLHNCHPFASCTNTFHSFQCQCGQGYAGDGRAHCNRTCRNECVHGRCSGPPHFSCECALGWTSNVTSLNLTATECDVDCGCNFHSTCAAAGVGTCDQCQDWTMGDHCEECRPGSYGNGSGEAGCRRCACNGHGIASQGECERHTGHCYCTHHTEGQHCHICAAGYYGDPRDGGTCYRECGGRVLLPNVTSSALGSMKGIGISPTGLAYCLWALSVSDSLEPCPGTQPCPSIALTVDADISLQCGKDYVYAFDGVPSFLTDSPPESSIYADPRLIGAFCGWGQEHPITVEAHSGVLIVYLEANVSRPAGTPWSGFNATYQLQECQPPCLPHRLCRGGVCRCREGVAGPDCPDLLCPNNCSWHLQAGYCHADSGRCVCAHGFAGSDCGSRIQPGTVVWETLTGDQSPAASGSPSPRLGHTMVEGPGSSLWVYGGLSISDGILSSLHSYSVPERRWRREMAVSGGEGPGPRYHHAAASDPSRHAMYLVGGLTPAGVASDSWRLDMVTRQWTLLTKSSLPAVCGHTLTLCRNSTLVLVGGYSPEDGFNHRLLQYQLHTHTWLPTQPAGTAPTGVYGHSAVYHGPTDALYVFGGYRFHLETVAASPELYGLHLPTLTWSLLAPSHGAKPVPRYFHVAGLLRDAVLVLGGRSHQRAFTNDILLYQINTNTWVTANSSELWTLGEGMPACIGHAAVTLEGRVYVSGGYGGVGIGGLSSLWLPADPCHLLPSAAACNTSGGCVWCLSVRNGSCLSHQQAHRYAVEGVMPVCEPVPRQWESCDHLRTCSECLAVPPRFTGHPQRLRCKWCTNCPEGACIGTNASCSVENDCRINQRQIFLAANCSETTCEASDCPKCTRSAKCMWTRQFKRTGETRRILSVNPSYDWTCFSHSLRNVSPMPVESSPPLPCPTPCHNLTTCATCLSSTGSDGGWQRCVWSLALQQCMSPSFTPLRCGGGACGRTLQGGRDSCDVPCQAHGQCCQCLHHPHCGWCSASGLDGIGRCLPGGLPGPWGAGTGMCAETEGHWAFTWCPPENECVNGHHTCDKTQNCTDTPQGFECVCRDGYMQDSEQAVCRPVCEQGCVNGTCVEPNQCRCHFGWVGTDCSLLCHCNQHSECAGVTQRDQCLQCVHNTQGDHCDQCRPLFVGSALEGGWCRPCSSFCNNNSYVCITKDQYVKWLLQPASHPLQPDQISSWVTEGPLEETALCVQCQNHSSGERCESCLDGYFLLDGKCTKCQCNGHWDRCRTSDGTECQCQNNTETSCPTAQTDNKECYKYQCARCKENFLGNPTQGGQCYRQITVEQEYCFDPTSQSNCYHEPRIRNLASGRSVFFAVQPKFTNVDIRITVDVTFGQLDVYLSDSHSSFAVWVEPLTGRHRLVLTGAGQAGTGTGGESLRRRRQTGPERRRRAVNVSQPVEGVVERRAEGLTTYVTVVRPRTVLVVRALRERLVVTFPYQRHALKTQRFFLALLGTAAAAGETQGLLFFRQDQAHIDLFVFFSVFFSCFFLFLAACVLLWKAKQSAEERREHRRQLQEMDKMASRPFARLTVYLEPTSAAPVPTPSVAMPASNARTRRNGHLTGGSSSATAAGAGATKPGPLTLEPTEDGLAAVATLLFHMPGGALAPNRACLGSALVALRHNLQEYCTAAAAQAAGNARKRAGGGGGHDLTPMSL